MSLTYAGIPLLLEDPGRQLADWIARAIALEDTRLFGREPVALHEGRWIPRNQIRAHVGLPTPNWPDAPRLKINTLWMPTGATRWGVGLFLADEERLDQIVTQLDGSNGADLVLSEDCETLGAKQANRSITFRMHLLPPRPIVPLWQSSPGTYPARLFLLPLVDERYLWQYVDAGALSVQCGDSWADVIDALAARLGQPSFVYDAVPGAYGGPDAVELTRQYENAAMLMDAVLWNVGQRLVPTLDPGVPYRAMNATTSATTLAANWEAMRWQMAGGQYEGLQALQRPDIVRVVFPRYQSGQAQADGNVYAIAVGGGAWTKTFFDTAQADFTSGGALPDNYAQLVALTNQIAADYYAATDGGNYDATYAGIAEWDFTGFCDAVEWCYAWQNPALRPADPTDDGDLDALSGQSGPGDYGAYAHQTRVTSLPYNCEIGELLHQFCAETSSSSSLSSESSEPSSSESSVSDSSSSTPSSSESSSSDSESSHSESSASESSADPCQEITVVTDVIWSAGDCTLTVVKETFRVPRC